MVIGSSCISALLPPQLTVSHCSSAESIIGSVWGLLGNPRRFTEAGPRGSSVSPPSLDR